MNDHFEKYYFLTWWYKHWKHKKKYSDFLRIIGNLTWIIWYWCAHFYTWIQSTFFFFFVTLEKKFNKQPTEKNISRYDFRLNLHSFEFDSSFIRGYFKFFTQQYKCSIANKFYNIDMKLAQSQATRALEKKLVIAIQPI